MLNSEGLNFNNLNLINQCYILKVNKRGRRCIMPLTKLNGININYQVEGQGEPLVMIMGFTANRSGWMPQVPFFK